jgi:dihydroflavonol-4-reductase
MRIASRNSGRRAPLVALPGLPFRMLAPVAGLVERLVALPPDMSAERLRAMGGLTYLASSAKAEREIGYSARPLEEGLRLTLEHEMRALDAR